MSRKQISDQLVCEHIHRYTLAIKNKGAFAVVPYPHETMSEETGQPEKICYRALERAFRKGLIEYGVSLRTGWLTEAGKKILEARTQ